VRLRVLQHPHLRTRSTQRTRLRRRAPSRSTLLADHDDAPTSWSPTELRHNHPTPAVPAESRTAAVAAPLPATDTPHSPAPQYPPGLDVSKYVRAPLAPQHSDRT